MTAFLAAAAPEPILLTRAEPILVEGVAFDARGRLLVSAVHAGGVFRVARNGRLQPWSQRDSRNGRASGTFGIVADPPRNALWAAESGGLPSAIPMLAPGLARYDLRTGRGIAFYYPAEGDGKAFGDLALGPDGTVFISDSGAGEVLRLAPGATSLERVIKLEGRASPQGLAVSDDGRVLVFSNYADGFHRVDLVTGTHTRVLPLDGTTLRGIDGVARRGDAISLRSTMARRRREFSASRSTPTGRRSPTLRCSPRARRWRNPRAASFATTRLYSSRAASGRISTNRGKPSRH